MENNRFKFRNGVMMKRMLFSWGVWLRRGRDKACLVSTYAFATFTNKTDRPANFWNY